MENNLDIKISINYEDWEIKFPDLHDICFDCIKMAFDEASNEVECPLFIEIDEDNDFEISLCLTDDNEVKKLNANYRNKDQATNVLSFANIDYGFDECFETIELGDIIVSLDTLIIEAKRDNISLYYHFCHLLVHGVLHLMGYDHINDDEANEMENLEAKILAKLNIPNPYVN